MEPTAVLTAAEDAFIVKNSPDANMGNSDLVVQKGAREGFMKFDLSGISAASVKFAKLRVRSNSQTQTGNTVQFQMIDDNWSESMVTWNNPPAGVTPGAAWTSTTPGNAVRVATPGPDSFYDIELASLVNYALSIGKTTLSLHITLQNSSPPYFICSLKESAESAYFPRLSIYAADSLAQTVTRKPVQETFVGSSGGGNTIYHNYKNWDYVQVGSSGSTIQYSLMQFNTSELEDADFVRLRIKAHNTLPAGDGVLRVAAYITDAWNETNLTWSTAKPWFPQPASVAAGTAIDGEVSMINLSQSRSDQPFIEMDVTEVVRRAARADLMITFCLFSSSRAWPEFYKRNGQSPVLIYPDPNAAFAKRIVGSLDQSAAEPSMRLSWSPSSESGVTYKVERQKNGTWITVATGLSAATCLDTTAEPYVEHTYRITALVNDTEKCATKTIMLAPKIKVRACADAFVFSGSKDAQNGTATSIVHKYDLNASGTREGFYRFDLSEVPANFKTATLKFYVAGPDGNHSGNEEFQVLKYPDFAWTDATAPTWNSVFGNAWSTPEARSNHPDPIRMSEVPVNSMGSVPNRLRGGESLDYDVSAMIRAAKANGESHVTFHTYAYDPDSQWSFDIISRERSQGLSCASQIVFTLKNWVVRGTKIVLR